jgi:hypothetical protein
MPGSNSKIWGRFCDGLGSNIVVQYSFGPIITFHAQITARKYMDWFEEHEGEFLSLPWAAQSPNLNTTEPL